MKQTSLTKFMALLIAKFETEGRRGTAHVYAAMLNATTTFMNGREIYFSMLTPEWLKRFETHLRNNQRKWNTVSTYMRMLRAVYNRALRQNLTAYYPGLFNGVYTGINSERKLALSAEAMNRLIYAPPSRPLSPEVEQSRLWLRLMFEFHGMPFVDLAHLHVSDLDVEKRLLTCQRQKTGTPLEISLTEEMMKLIVQHGNTDCQASPYLFSILTPWLSKAESYNEYQRQLSRVNYNLGKLARIQGVNFHVSTYTGRHTWATQAKYCHISDELICDALGHKSIKTTEIYLKSFENSDLKRANSKVIGTVKRAVTL